MNQRIPMLKLILFSLGGGIAAGEIPLPDGVLYGNILVNGKIVSAAEEVTVVARQEGMTSPVAVFRLGSHPAAGDRFVLWLRHAVQDDGSTPSTNVPKPGENIKIYLRKRDGPETFVGEAVVPASGEVRMLDLFATDAQLEARPVGESGFTPACSRSGGMCGALGATNLGIMFLGLAQMKYRRSRRRQYASFGP